MKVIQLRNLLLALLILALNARADAGLLQHHIVVAAVVGDDRLVIDVRNMRADVVQKVTIMRDRNDGAVIALQKILQPVNRLKIQIVRRLIQQQRLRIAKQRLRQQHANLLPALQLAHLALVQLIRNIQPLQQHRRIGLGLVAILVADDAFELAQPRPVRVRHLGLVVDDLALFHRRPQRLVAHDDRIDHAVRVKLILVLLQHAQLLGAHDRALLGINLAG
jgi:hypothetical protein